MLLNKIAAQNREYIVLYLCGEAISFQGGTTANVPQVTSASLSELLEIPPYSEIEKLLQKLQTSSTQKLLKLRGWQIAFQ